MLGSTESRPGFLRRGVTAASLRGGGAVPEFREEWIVSMMSGVREVKLALTSSEAWGPGERWKISWWRIFWRGLLWLGS